MSDAEYAKKIQENRVRRMADRQGLRLVKSRRRDPNALGYGCYMLVDASTNIVLQYEGMVGPTGEPGWTLADVEALLTGGTG